jgi:MFS family permease
MCIALHNDVGTASAELFRLACGGDPTRTAIWLTSSLSAGALLEVFCFQLVGRATDRTGRKHPWLFLSPAMSFVAGVAPCLVPRLPVVWASRLLTSSFSALFGVRFVLCFVFCPSPPPCCHTPYRQGAHVVALGGVD